MDRVVYDRPGKGVICWLVQWCPFGGNPRGEKMGVFQKNGTWWIDFYHQGQRVRRKVGSSKKLAELALADVRLKAAKNEFLGICEPKRIRFKDFGEEYLEYSQANKRKATFERDAMIVRKKLVPLWGGEQLNRITPKMVEDYKLSRSKLLRPSTVNRDLNVVKALFNKAIAWSYIKESPAKPIKPMKVRKGIDRFLSEQEVGALLDACQGAQKIYLYPVVCIAIFAGLRRGEILRLRWEDVDFKANKLHVVSREGAPTKNGESRSVPMNRTLREILRRHPRRLDTPYLFHHPDGKPFDQIDNSFSSVRRRSGIAYFRFHDLRHTFASHLVMAGVDIRTVQELLGHKDIKMTMRYAHLGPEHMRKAVEVLDGHYMDTRDASEEKVACRDEG
jgi:integrase